MWGVPTRAGRLVSVPRPHLHADTHAQPLGHEYLGVGVGRAQSELHVGYEDAAAVWKVDPQLSYTPRLMQSARPTLSNAEV